MFKEAGLIERYGSGIMRVRRICKEYGVVEPSFGEMANGFKVTLFKELTMNEYANNSLIVSDFKVDIKKELEKDTVKQTEKGTEKGTEKLSKNQLLILNYITENKNITIEELTSRIAISASKVKANISKLKQKGFLKRIGPDKGGYWLVIER